MNEDNCIRTTRLEHGSTNEGSHDGTGPASLGGHRASGAGRLRGCGWCPGLRGTSCGRGLGGVSGGWCAGGTSGSTLASERSGGLTFNLSKDISIENTSHAVEAVEGCIEQTNETGKGGGGKTYVNLDEKA